MGIDNGGNLIFKMTNVVARELDMMVNLGLSKHASDNAPTSAPKKSIACDISNIIHNLAYGHSCIYDRPLVLSVAEFLKRLAADTGYVVTPVLDGNVRPQSKRDAFKRRYESTMNRVNSFFCRQSAMKLAAKAERDRSDEEKTKLVEYNKEAKRLEKSGRLHIPPTFTDDLETALEEIGAYFPDRFTGGVVRREMVQAEYKSNYMIAYRVRNGLSTLVYSSDADMVALCGPETLCIRSFVEENKKRGSKRKRNNSEIDTSAIFTYEITGGSNSFMHEIKACISSNSQSSLIQYKEAKHPILEAVVPPFLTALYVVGIGCDVLPGGVSGVTSLFITKELKKMEEAGIGCSQHSERFDRLIDIYLKKDKKKKVTKGDLLTY